MPTTETNQNSAWRRIGVGILLTLGCLALGYALVGGFIRGLLFDTDKWVETVTPLPREEAIANAIGTKASEALFQNVDVQARIKEALPERAAFLAAPLTTQLQTSTTNLATNTVKSDSFQTVWVTANRAAHTQLVNFIDTEPKLTGEKVESIQLKLSDLTATVKQRLGQQSGAGLAPVNAEAPVNLGVKLEKVREWRTLLRNIHNSPAVAPAVTAALLAAALALSRSRRRTLLAGSLGVVATMVILLIVEKAVKTDVIAMVGGSLNQQALTSAWDIVLQGLRRAFTTTLIIGAIIAIGTLVAYPYRWATWLRRVTGLTALSRSVRPRLSRVREFVRTNLVWFAGGGVVVAAAGLLLVSSLTWFTIASVIAWLITYLCLAVVVAARRA